MVQQKSKYGKLVVGALTLILGISFEADLLGQAISTQQTDSDSDKKQLDSELYFPSPNVRWETIEPAKVGWDSDKLDAALKFAGERNSSGVVILHQGKILAEQYWKPKKSFRYKSMLHGVDGEGHDLEDVASVQKSVAATLLGIALDRDLVKLDDPVHKHLGVGWSRASQEQEAAIILRHVISMSTGLTDKLEYKVPPGTQWRYNTNAYSRIVNVLEAASKLKRNELTRKWLTEPIGMEKSSWVVRPFARQDPKTNRHGFATSARELAKFGLLIHAKGSWNGKQVIEEKKYFRSMFQPSQKLNPSYGYLWWLNGQSYSLRAGRKVIGPLNKAAPNDLVAGLGALGRKVYIVPSLNLVVTRLGDDPGKRFDPEFWKRLMAAAPPK